MMMMLYIKSAHAQLVVTARVTTSIKWILDSHDQIPETQVL